ncbi:Retrovirus-related Pol polyprotein from transposon TNT 1-94 [Araneus ventricosus]|uniref:Retrovirus-related Pol polyprotein from transposon TNT 1-94 n=1 Tax=Araneus ventricosus TaxID=182803 RepID=A0A4Y2SQ57_ARAVE|nr:Retrovirus-related Pol polyprotein from transposon TNT 1-94 [Araneus ventricosus]
MKSACPNQKATLKKVKHLKIRKSLIKYGFEQSKADPCLFKFANNGNSMYIIVYVDDLLIAGKEEDIRKIIKELEEEYELKNLGEVNYYLRINIKRTKEGNFALNQKNKIEEIVEKFNLKEAKPTNIPMDPNYLKQEGEDYLLPNNTQYRKAVGALLYIATVSRPNIAVAVNILNRRNEKPRERDWKAVKRIIRYLKTTAELKLIINMDKEPILTAFCDADWANDKSDRKSTSGSVFKLGNCTIQWMSKRQNCVALSSTEAEYVSAANTAQVVVWLINLTKDLDLPQSLPVTIYEDNQSCIKLSQSDKHHSRTKHIDVKFHKIRHLRETVTDHHSLCWLANVKDPSGRLARWALRLQEYDITIVYKSGRKHSDADSLSRNPLVSTSVETCDEIPTLASVTEYIKEQLKDPKLKSIIKVLKRGDEYQNYLLKDGVLYKKTVDPMGQQWLLVVPKQLRGDILRSLHDAPTAGHLGFAKTYDRIRRKYYWPGLYGSTRRYISHCKECQRRKTPPQLPPGRLQPIEPPDIQFAKVGIDLLGRFPVTRSGNRWIIVCTDYLTRFTVT